MKKIKFRRTKPFMIVHECGQVFFTYGCSIKDVVHEHEEQGEKLIFCKAMAGPFLLLGMLLSDYNSGAGKAAEEFFTEVIRSVLRIK